MRAVRLLMALLVACFGAVQPVDSAPTGSTPAAEFLTESYSMSSEFDDFEIPYYLSALTMAAVDTGDNRREEWAKNIFQRSFSVRNGWDRVSLEKDSLVQLSSVNAILAMDLFSKVEDPQPDDEGKFPEDVRAHAAIQIFQNYWNSKDINVNGLPAIQSQAKHIAETGEYPYQAMAFVIGKLTQKEETNNIFKEEANNIFREATEFFRLGPSKFGNRNKEFELFLEKTKDSIADRDLFRRTLHIYLERISRDISQGGSDFRAELHTPAGIIYFNNRDELFLFRAFGMISASDTAFKTSLVQLHPYLSKYAPQEKTRYISYGFVHGDLSPEQSANLHNKMSQSSLLAEVTRLQRTNPVEAMSLAQTLNGTGMRILGLSSTITGFTRTDPATAGHVYLDQLTHLQEVTDELENLRVRVALAHAAVCVQDDANFHLLSSDSLNAGLALVEEDFRHRPDLRTEQLKGFKEVNDIVIFAAANGLQKMVDLTRQMPKGKLKAYLLIALARSTKQQKPCS